MSHRISLFCATAAAFIACPAFAQDTPPTPIVLGSGWRMQDAAKIKNAGNEIARAAFPTAGWYRATVPGTVLTTLVDNGVYPEPLYGENNRPDRIPEGLCRTDWWYRVDVAVPRAYTGRKIWLNFDGINYAADVWVNGKNAGSLIGAFRRGVFDVTDLVTPGKTATVAVRVSPQPHPGVPHEHTIERGMGANGGITAIDGPTFLCSLGWDWIPAIRDRNTGIWQKVTLSATGPVTIEDPLVTTDLPKLPDLSTADIGVQATLRNTSGQPQQGVLKGNFASVSFAVPVEIPAHGIQRVSLDPKTTPALRLAHPRLWWPNGYGPQNLYALHLTFDRNGSVSDARDISFGVRKIAYSVPDSGNLTLSVNGVRVFCKGGDWGMDEAMKRIPRARLEAEIRMHHDAHLTMIRNWVGQSTSEDFYDLCDKYGILLWDEFFQPNPSDGPNPTDLETYVANVRDKVLRFRNHPSIAVWCARNEGYPPPEIDAALRKVLAELEPGRRYQPSSTDGQGVHSGGPYSWRTPRQFYAFNEPFKTEIGSVSIPTFESIQGMMPSKDWTTINDDWAEHDLAAGASRGDSYRETLDARYGKVQNLADFARKGQMANYEAFRAMFEGRNAKLFAPSTGVITWMSNPAQPSFVWQLYHHDLEPNASLYAVQKACEPLHVQMNESNGHLGIINNTARNLAGLTVTAIVYNLDGTVAYTHKQEADAAAASATDLGAIPFPANLSRVYFVRLNLAGADKLLSSTNFYWRVAPENHPDDLTDLNSLPVAHLETRIKRQDTNGLCRLEVMLRNPGPQAALMAHLQLRRRKAGTRVLPVFYSDNYLNFAPGEMKTVTIEAASADLKGDSPLVVLDGWNIGVKPGESAAVELNQAAQVDHWPKTGLPVYLGPPQAGYRIHCGGEAIDGFEADRHYAGGRVSAKTHPIDTAGVSHAAPAGLYLTERWDPCTYTLPMLPNPAGYTVRLHFAETSFEAAGKRRFVVEINGKPVLTDFDVFQEAGGKAWAAVVREFTGIQPNPDGNIVIRLRRGTVDRPEINGIEIVK